MVDVAIIGGGVIGAFCARELRKYAISVAVLEGAEDVAAGASKANSGIVHAGYDAENGTLKAKFNVAGNKLMPKVCEELGVGYRNNGSLVLAERDRVGVLSQLKERGEMNGVKGLEVIGRARALALEPHLGDGVAAALYAPTGGIVCPFQLTIAAMGNAMDNGASLYCGFEVAAAEKTDGGWSLVSSDHKRVEARCVVNCAGLNSEKVANLFGDHSFHVHGRKGEYILLDHAWFVDNTLFTVPTKAGKGVLVTETDNTLTDAQNETFEKLFSSISLIERVDSAHMGIGMCIAGCAPAFTDMYIEALGDAGVKYGLQRATAYRLAAKMVEGVGALYLANETHPGAMKDAVCSPGGTTIKGVASLEESAFRGAVIKAVDAIEA